MRRPADAGVTLVEMLVALALFALIGAAGFGVLDTILRAEARTEGRMARLAAIDTTLRLLARDLETGAPETLRLEADTVTVAATGPATGTLLTWRSADGVLVRSYRRGDAASPVDQAVLDGVAGAAWQVLAPDGQWRDTWPSDGGQGAPRGAALDLSLDWGAGAPVSLRRLFVFADIAPPPRRPLIAPPPPSSTASEESEP